MVSLTPVWCNMGIPYTWNAIDSELVRGASSLWKHVLLAASDQMLDGNATDHHDM